MLAAVSAVVFALCAACASQRSGIASPASSTDAAPAEHVVLRFRPVLQGPEPATGSAVPTTGTPPADPAGPVTQDQAAAQYATLSCDQSNAAGDTAQPADYVASCTTDGQTKYLLGPAIVGGEDITHARAGKQHTTGEWAVLVYFDAAAENAWAQYTADNVGSNVALTLDGRVISAPVINGAITSNPTTITGSFTEETARRLARDLDGG